MRRIIPLALFLAGATTAAAQQPCVSDAAQVVDHIYRQVLQRPPDPEAAGIAHRLAAGEITPRAIVAALAASPEYEERFYWPPIVSGVYQLVLQRQASPAEVRAASAQLTRGGLTPSDFVAGVATRAVNNSPDAIRVVYRRLLGREPDPDGLAAYTAIAQRDGIGAVTLSIVDSREYRARATPTGMPPQMLDAHADAVRAMYRQILGREADPDGLLALVELAGVYGAKGPIDRIVGSPEYRERYGEDGVPGTNVRFCGPPEGRFARPRR